MFKLILGGMLLGMAACVYWLTGRWLSFYGIRVKEWKIRLLRLAVSAVVLILSRRWKMAGFAAVHLTVLFLLTEILAFPVRRLGKAFRERSWYRLLRRIYRSGLVPVVGLCLILGLGALNMQRIVCTEYTVETDKVQSEYKIALLTDIHYGTIQNPELLKNKIEEINALKPDAVVLGGDIVEEDTSGEMMREAFEVLGNLKSVYGTYYVYGNHDRQFYADMMSGSRHYTVEELKQAIEENGITILDDKWVSLGDELILAGREDVGRWQIERLSTEQLLKDADKNKFLIVADHQPVGAKENAAQGVDLELSGHTHAGQIFPVGWINTLMGALNYGRYQEGDCTVIVSSGIGGWGFPVRTQGKCEYVLVTVHSST